MEETKFDLLREFVEHRDRNINKLLNYSAVVITIIIIIIVGESV
jgi:hypothetical protein